MSDEPDFFKQAEILLRKLSWAEEALERDDIKIKLNKKYGDIQQQSMHEFRSYLAMILAVTYKNGQNDVRKKIRKALDIS